IESAVAAGKDHEAADWLNYLTGSQHSPRIEPAIDYLQGAIDARAGRAGAAETAWKEVAASNDQLYRVRAELALVDLGVATGSLTPAQAADRLEALRFAWRGDDLEVDILHRLGAFYIEAKNVKAGLNTLARAVALYPDSPMTPSIRIEMEHVLHDVFLGNLGKNLSPLDELALYQQYGPLMPRGKDGITIMHDLAERLVAVDLLDPAVDILDDLAKNRLQGIERDKVALQLAGIQLLDHKPGDALDALGYVGGSDPLTPKMKNEEILLHARALSGQKHPTKALALLQGNTSKGAQMLRADIAMHNQDWPGAATALMSLVGPPPTNGTSLSSDQVNWLLHAAIAYALIDDQPDLDKLAIDYGKAMSVTPQKDTFMMLTQPQKTGQLRDLAAAEAQISQVDMFQSFLNAYRTIPDAQTKKP
ncbi:MAG: hypothetical protein KGI97_07050, partial [Alphaproteobacteria bacterium]|nr:hypothetical protein [Alphaproteobacteria bacterium]